MEKLINHKVWFSLFQAWLILCTAAFLMPTNQLKSGPDWFGIPHFDKLVHTGIFFVYSFLIFMYNGNFLRSAIITVIFTAFYGILIETLQRTVGRGFDIKDYLFDFIGVGIFFNIVFICKVFKDYVKPKFKRK